MPIGVALWRTEKRRVSDECEAYLDSRRRSAKPLVIEAQETAKADHHARLLRRLAHGRGDEVLTRLDSARREIEGPVSLLDDEIASLMRDDGEHDESSGCHRSSFLEATRPEEACSTQHLPPVDAHYASCLRPTPAT